MFKKIIVALALLLCVDHAAQAATQWRAGYVHNTECNTSGSYPVVLGDNAPAPANDDAAACVSLDRAWSPTYVYAASAITGYSSPSDLFCLSGSNSRVVRIVSFSVWPNSTSNAQGMYYFVKRSSLDTGGSPVTPVQVDSAAPAPTGLLTQFFSAPTLGTAVGNVAVDNQSSIANGSTPSAAGMSVILGTPSTIALMSPITLRSASESVCLNVTSLASGWSATLLVQWTESQ